MERLKKRLVVGLTVIAAFALAGMALAAEGDDTVLNYGYDQENHFFIWNVTSLDYSPDDALLEETLEGYEEEQFAALLEACGLEGDDPENPDTYTYTYDPATGLITVSSEGDSEGGDTDSEEIVCGEFQGGDVTGPAGQVNHGMFLKFFNENYEGEGRGCIVRHIARSGLGKGDQQVKVDDTASDEPTEPAEEETEVVEGSISFTTVTTDCHRGKGGADEETEDNEGGGPPEHVLQKFGGQHPRDANGKPDNPGRP
ncbi:MAG TPA: hypothetical protein VFS66_09615 [Acidimicrobiia bacterium]|nr:hypothetical protein [Acidimicrobiia bacterium]